MGGDFCFTEQFEDDTANKTQERVKKDNKKKSIFYHFILQFETRLFGLL